MKVSWKKTKSFKPEVILEKINSIKTITEDRRVSYSASAYHDAVASLHSMISFPARAEVLDKEYLIEKAISTVALDNDLTPDLVIKEINKEFANANAVIERKYNLVTSVSLRPPYPKKIINIEDCKIRLIDGDLPKKYNSRYTLLPKKRFEDHTPPDYAKVIITLKAKTEKSAVTKALRAFDIQRGIWCLFGNSGLEIFGDEWSPINKVRLGEVHTLHKESGKVASELVWYEPNFVKANGFSPTSLDVYTHNTDWFFKRIYESSYSEELLDSLIRYVRALDEKDQNVALIKLWGAIETLAAPKEANYDKVVKRCSFLFGERDYHMQVLEHLREYRNSSVHAGDQGEKAKNNCYQLQNYFHRLLMFHLHNVDNFSSLDEANQFLDLPDDLQKLERKRELIDKAIVFLNA